MVKKIVVTMLILVLCAGASFALGGHAGDHIIAPTENLSASYDDGAGTPGAALDTSAVGPVDQTISAVYGLDVVAGNYGPLTPAQGGQGALLTRQVSVKNVGNEDDTELGVNTGASELTPMPGEGSVVGDWDALVTYEGFTTINEEDTKIMEVSVTVPPKVVKGTSYNIELTAATNKTPFGLYTGFNLSSYGGPNRVTEKGYFEVTGIPVLSVIFRDKAITSPGNTYGGGAGEAAPGALIMYTIVVKNTGTAGASNIVINDVEPLATSYYADSATADATNVIAFDSSEAAGTVTWTQNPTAGTYLKVDEVVTFNYSVVIQ